MFRLRQQFTIPHFTLPLGTATTWQGKAGGCGQAGRPCSAPGQKQLRARGSLGAVYGGCWGSRLSPKPCWVSWGVQLSLLLELKLVAGLSPPDSAAVAYGCNWKGQGGGIACPAKIFLQMSELGHVHN